MSQQSTTTPEVVYPESDGKPIAENTLQFRWIVTLQGGLDDLFRDRAEVFVAGDLLWYPVEGDPRINAAPDAMVIFGRPKGDRGSYRQFEEEGIAPQVVFEVLSPSNYRAEMENKRQWYQRYGVLEYYEYDPDRRRLRGWMRDSDAEEFREVESMDGHVSTRTGLRFVIRPGEEMEVYRPDGEPLFSYLEQAEAAREHRRQAQLFRERMEQQRLRAEEAEAKVQELLAQLREHRADPSAPSS